ncbi:BspC domain-containing protein [Candidatus Vallotia cooleyia]|uniref:BspC domain-containing protein n=1 Tax=Candidatus Vallotiella adelgis TaxID=1177211 RepID=UPI001D0072E8|nr:hypothetical protein [Candidatus Vallotia cooleyia]UDG82375.1 hypothetical protein GJV44_00644 [Candidatus Vallotia cooleyia]
MDRKSTSRLIGIIVLYTLAIIAIVSPTIGRTNQVQHHNELVYQFITQMRAHPLVADCAAHADFIVGTSSVFDRVKFLRSSFDAAHAEVKAWQGSFDQGKQRVKVDLIVTLRGIGIRKHGASTDVLRFRCGYVNSQILAFSWNDPVAPFKPAVPGYQPSQSKKTLRGSSRKSSAKVLHRGGTNRKVQRHSLTKSKAPVLRH